MSKDSTKPLQEFQRNVTLPYAIDERVNLRAALLKDAWLEPAERDRVQALKCQNEQKKVRCYVKPAFCA